MPNARIALSFSGSGHLLCYQLGVADHIFNRATSVCVSSVGGCSGGAIVAAICSCLPPADIVTFAKDYAVHGRSWEGLQSLLPADAAVHASDRCHVGVTELGSSSSSSRAVVLSSFTDREHLLQSLRASCHIPRSFHPMDLTRRTPPNYPTEEAFSLGRRFFVDGGISAAGPALPVSESPAPRQVIVSPISGPTSEHGGSIRPADHSFGVGRVRLGGLAAYLSVQNLRALILSVGGGSEGLRRQFELGTADAEKWCREQHYT
jgi:predicted acylesterase/phospholipase RssA